MLYGAALELIPAEAEERHRSVRLQRSMVLVESSKFVEAARELDELLPALAGEEKFEALRGRALAAVLPDAGGGIEHVRRARVRAC